jgi:hypothetical protein
LDVPLKVFEKNKNEEEKIEIKIMYYSLGEVTRRSVVGGDGGGDLKVSREFSAESG